MNKNEKDWQHFLEDHKYIEEEFSSNFEEEFKKEYGLTLFSGALDDHFVVFNTQINILQFVKLLRYFFGISGIEIGHSDEEGYHFHNVDDEFDELDELDFDNLYNYEDDDDE